MGKNDYIEKYNRIYADIVDGGNNKAEELIKRLADVLVMMDECKAHTDSEGCVSEMCQGNYSISRENPWSKAFDAKTKIMLAIIDKLDKMSSATPAKDDELMEFIKR